MKLVQELDLKKKALLATCTLQYCHIPSFMYSTVC